MKQVGTQYDMYSVTILPVFGGKCDSENLVGPAHKQVWQPPAANMGPLGPIEFCDLWSQGTVAASGRKIHVLGLRRVNDGHTRYVQCIRDLLQTL